MNENKLKRIYETDKDSLDSTPRNKIKDSHPTLTLVHKCRQTGYILPSSSKKANVSRNEDREEGQDQRKTSSWYEAPSSLTF